MGFKEQYLECAYHMVNCFVKIAGTKPTAAERGKLLRQAATQVVQIERNWEDFGSESSKKRFTERIFTS